MRIRKTLVSILLSLTLVVSFMPSMAFAVEGDVEPSESGKTAVASYQSEPQTIKSSDKDTDDLLTGYMAQKVREKTAKKSTKGFRSATGHANRLDEKSQRVYNIMKGNIQDVAEGTTLSTEFTLSFEDILGADAVTYEDEIGDLKGWIRIQKQDLGLDGVDILEEDDESGETYVTEDAINAIYDYFSFDVDATLNALTADCPYELYWYDKVTGTSYSYSLPGIAEYNGYVYLYDPVYCLDMCVSADYSLRGETGTFELDAERVEDVNAAIVTAQKIIADNSSVGNTDKLKAYKAAICALTDYDDNAAESSDMDYGDPWQMISVFDGNDSTNVVCEGYSKAFQFLCDNTPSLSEAGIECISVTGKMTGGTGAGPHMWNIVHMPDNNNYIADITNCDGEPGGDENSIGYPNKLFLTGAIEEGSIERGFEYDCDEDDEPDVVYMYDRDTKALYSEEELVMAAYSYPALPITIHGGNTYYEANINDSEKEYQLSWVVDIESMNSSNYSDLFRVKLKNDKHSAFECTGTSYDEESTHNDGEDSVQKIITVTLKSKSDLPEGDYSCDIYAEYGSAYDLNEEKLTTINLSVVGYDAQAYSISANSINFGKISAAESDDAFAEYVAGTYNEEYRTVNIRNAGNQKVVVSGDSYVIDREQSDIDAFSIELSDEIVTLKNGQSWGGLKVLPTCNIPGEYQLVLNITDETGRASATAVINYTVVGETPKLTANRKSLDWESDSGYFPMREVRIANSSKDAFKTVRVSLETEQQDDDWLSIQGGDSFSSIKPLVSGGSFSLYVSPNNLENFAEPIEKTGKIIIEAGKDENQTEGLTALEIPVSLKYTPSGGFEISYFYKEGIQQWSYLYEALDPNDEDYDDDEAPNEMDLWFNNSLLSVPGKDIKDIIGFDIDEEDETADGQSGEEVENTKKFSLDCSNLQYGYLSVILNPDTEPGLYECTVNMYYDPNGGFSAVTDGDYSDFEPVDSVDLSCEVYTRDDYSISVSVGGETDPDVVDLGPLTAGYDPEATTITVENIGSKPLVFEPESFIDSEEYESGTFVFDFGNSKEVTLNSKESYSFTVKPAKGKPAGNYSTEIGLSSTDHKAWHWLTVEYVVLNAGFSVQVGDEDSDYDPDDNLIADLGINQPDEEDCQPEYYVPIQNNGTIPAKISVSETDDPEYYTGFSCGLCYEIRDYDDDEGSEDNNGDGSSPGDEGDESEEELTEAFLEPGEVIFAHIQVDHETLASSGNVEYEMPYIVTAVECAGDTDDGYSTVENGDDYSKTIIAKYEISDAQYTVTLNFQGKRYIDEESGRSISLDEKFGDLGTDDITFGKGKSLSDAVSYLIDTCFGEEVFPAYTGAYVEDRTGNKYICTGYTTNKDDSYKSWEDFYTQQDDYYEAIVEDDTVVYMNCAELIDRVHLRMDKPECGDEIGSQNVKKGLLDSLLNKPYDLGNVTWADECDKAAEGSFDAGSHNCYLAKINVSAHFGYIFDYQTVVTVNNKTAYVQRVYDKDGNDKGSCIYYNVNIDHRTPLTEKTGKTATCAEAGNVRHWECSGCGTLFADRYGVEKLDPEVVNISAKGHNLIKADAGEASCTKNGNSAYWYCARCKKYFSDEAAEQEIEEGSWVIPATNHQGTITKTDAKAETCTDDGNSAYWYCSKCGKYFSDASNEPGEEISKDNWIIKKTGHNYGDWQEGDETEHIKVCANDPTHIKKEAHDWDLVEETPATESNKGQKSYECKVCGASKVEETPVLPHEHDIQEVAAKDASCTEDGNIKHYECSKCHAKFSDASGNTELQNNEWIIPATNHQGTLTKTNEKAATCTEAGNVEYWYCDKCEKYFADENCTTELSEQERVKPATGHSQDLEHKAAATATCTEAGNAEYWYCDKCEKYFADENCVTELSEQERVKPATGHDWEFVDFSWTKTDSGYTAVATYECGNNVGHKDTVTAAVTKGTETPSTCKTKGSVPYSASVSAESSLDKTAHNENKIYELDFAPHTLTPHAEQAATCSATGNHAYWTCDVCGKVFSDEACQNETTVDKVTIGIDQNAHDWKFVDFSWTKTDSGYTAVATYECGNNVGHKDTVTAAVTKGTETPSTCKTKGSVPYSASVSAESSLDKKAHNENKTYELDYAPHTLTEHPYTAETKDKPGNTAYWSCDVCNKYFSNAAGTKEITKDSWLITDLRDAKTAARDELEAIDLDAYDDNDKAAIRQAVNEALAAIEDAETVEAVNAARTTAIEVRNSRKTIAEKAEEARKAEARMKATTTVTVNAATVDVAAINKAITAAGGSSKYVTTIILGPSVKKIGKNTFSSFKAVNTLRVKTKKLKAKSVKGSLKGSAVSAVKVEIGSKKVNKKYVKKYKKFFTKKNAGRKAKVK